MSFEYELIAKQRNGSNRDFVVPEATKSGELYVVKNIPDFMDAVLKKKVWKVQDLTTTVVLNDVLPTTASGLTVQNPTTDLWYVVYGFSVIGDVSPASLGAVSFSHAAHKASVLTAYTRDVALTTVGPYLPGQGAYPGAIILDRGATVVDDGWTPIGKMISNVVNSQTWLSYMEMLKPAVVIPPGTHWSLGATGNDATFEVGFGLLWGEFSEDELK